MEPRLRVLPAVLLGLLCQALVVFWIVHSEIPGKVFISSWSVSMPGILLLALLGCARAWLRGTLLGLLLLTTLWNLHAVVTRGALISPFAAAGILGLAGIAWVAGRGAVRLRIASVLDRKTLLLAYLMVAVSGILTGYGHLQMMMPALGAVIYRATPENRWARFHEHLPGWLFPKSPEALKGLFSGESAVPWGDWLVPLCFWFLFLMAAYGAMLFLAAILSRQWISGERLAFPVAQLPLEMTADGYSLFRNRFMWAGFAIPTVLESLIALNYYFPAIPAVEIKHKNMQPFWFPERPFSVMTPFYFGWTPFIVGFAYFAPLDVSFSVWFFNWVAKGQRVLGAMTGWDAAGGGVMANRFPYPEEQAFGAFMAFALAALWRTWPGIRRAWKERRRGDEEGRVMLFSVAGLAVCVAVMLAFFAACGVPLWVGMVALGLILLIAITLSRIRAEAGPAWVFGPYRDVTRAMAVSLGASSFSERELAALSGFRWFSRDVRFLPMPFHMEAFKVADAGGIPKRTAMGVMAVATAVGVILGFFMVLTLSYQIGLGTGKTYGGPIGGATGIWNQANDWAKNRTLPDQFGIPWIIGGGLFTLFLIQMRSLFIWWPFHPIGYVMAETGAGGSFWFHYLLAWVLKLVVLRYGGHRLYVRTLPFVLGLILGDILTQTVWSALAVLFNIPVYQFIS
jgi:uncharacterized protein DUF6785/uncharacterized protein DUF6784